MMQIRFLLIFLFLTLAPSAAFAYPGEMNGTVTDIVDGDTFHIVAVNGTKYTVRMADVNAVEIGQAGYAEAKAALTSKIAATNVYLDVDDLYIWDNRGTGSRVVAISYIEYNSTHFLNVNEAMFLGGYVAKSDYPNEFNPYSWRLYEPKEEGIPEFPSGIFLFLIILPLLVVARIYRKRHANIRIGRSRSPLTIL